MTICNRTELFEKYPSIALNLLRNNVKQTPELGFKHLCVLEPRTLCPANWAIAEIRKYSSFITFNEKFCKQYDIMNMSYILDGCFGLSLPEGWDSFKAYDKKIKGILLLGKRGHNAYKEQGNIYYLREEMLDKLPTGSKLLKHVYSEIPWVHPNYQGICLGKPWGIPALGLTNAYLFSFCPENTYHPLWSYGYFTERIFRCFRAKTVAIYFGCYNIEDYIPKDLFIDLRDFYDKGKVDWNRLAKYLIDFSKEKYIEMTEKAFEWEKTTSFCSIEKMENLFKELHRRTLWEQEQNYSNCILK